MSCGLTMFELYILYRIVYVKRRWCDKHISQIDLIKGCKKDKLHLYKDAIDSLVKKGYLKQYKSQGRADVCVIKHYRYQLIDFLQRHRTEYDFLQHLEFRQPK